MMANKRIAPKTDAAPEPGVFDPEVALALLRSFREGDQEDQEEQERALAEFMRALDEDRAEGRKLFPDRC